MRPNNAIETDVAKLPLTENVEETIFYSDSTSYTRDIARIREQVRGS